MDDIQSWWEVPSIAHFCSLFRVAFNLLDFDIEELEEALLTDGTEFNGSSLLQDLIVRLLCGCLGHNGISTFNYQMFLRRLFRTKCKEQGRENPFNTDIDFQFLPLRTKVEILHALCDFRLDADDVIDVLKNLDSDSLRVHPLGHDETKSAYWYFYGTRLYKEEYPKKRKKRKDHDKSKKKRKEESSLSSSEEDLERRPTGTWRVMCYTESDWRDLARSMVGSTSRDERALYAVLSEDFLPEIPRLFEEKERLQRKRAAEAAPRRASRRLEKIRQEKEEDAKRPRDDRYSERERVNREKMEQRERRAARALRRRNGSDQSDSSDTIGSSLSEDTESTIHPVGRQTNNSLSSATGEIFIQPTRQKFRTPQLFKRTREDLMTGMYKILDRVKAHDDAWPFLDPVNEKYAPKYYSVIAKPMDLQTMEDKLDNGEYGSLQQFKADFQLVVDNCRQYNGSENEYTEMVRRLQEAFEASAERYLEADRSSSDDEVPLIMHRNDVCMTTDESSLSHDNRRLSRSSSNHSSLSNGSHQKPPFMNRDSSGERFLNRDNKVDKNRLRKKQKRKKKTSKLAFPSHDDDSDDSSEERYRQEKRKLNNKRRDVSSDRFERRSGSSSRDTSKDRLLGAMQKTVTNRSRNRVRVKRKAGSGGKQRKSSEEDSSSGLSKDKLFGRSSRDTSKERSRDRVRVNYKERVTSESEMFSTDTDDSHYESQLKAKTSPKKTVKKAGIIKNVEALEALELATEQTLRDINKWLDDTPRFSDFSSCSNSPSHMPYMEDMSTLEGEYRRRLLMDRPVRPRDRFSNDLHRRRMFKEQMGMKRRREIQRTIDRLQPGKSKGNLLSKENQQNNNAEGGGAEAKGSGNENDENAPKISLGKVLPSELLSFGIGESQKKDSEDDCTEDKLVIEDFTEAKEEKKDEVEADVKKEVLVEVDKKAEKVETVEPKKEKPTPNLSAWFKAFGAPKAQPQAKRKPEPEENKSKEDENEEEKRINVESQSPARRQRKASTGSSVSERSSFSMEPVDGNSPRPSIDEPYLSPQQEVKAYHHSPINGTIKVGFYQDTCFPRGTSDKSSSPRDLTGCSPRDLPSVSPRTSYCSPRNPAFSPRDYPNASPRTEYCSPRATPMSPREYPSSPREPPSSSPLHYPSTPREVITHSRDYATISREPVSKPPDYTSYSVPHTSHATPMYSHYPSHLTYYDASKPVETKNLEKSSVPVYPVKKRAYNDIDNQVSKACEAPSYKGGSFTPTRGAMEQERTFTPTPGRMPGSSRVPDAGLPMALPHALQHRFDHYPEERHISSPFYSGEPVYTKNPIYSGAASVGLPGGSYSREQQNYDRMAENQSPMSPSYHNNSRSSTPAYTNSPHDPQRSATPVISYPSRTSTPVHTVSPTSTPINYSNISDTIHKDKSPPIKDIPSTSASISYSKPSDILSGKISTTSSPLPYGASRMDVLPPKVNSVYNRTLPELAHGINYNAGQDLSKISVPLGYSNQSEMLAAKMNYNHPMADLMQSQARYNYQMSELMQGKAAVYNHPMQDFMQGKTSAYSNMNLAGYNRPISEIMQSKVNEIQARDMVYSSRTVPTSKAESTPAKTTKKTRKKKNEVPSGFQQYVSPGTEPISLKGGAGGVPGSAFNFGPSLKETYPYLDDIRTPYYVGHGAEGSSGKSGAPYFLGHSSGRTPPTYPHPFMNPQYQQYLQRHSEELLRPMVLPQGLLPPTGYPPGYLGIHDRPTWL